MKRIVLFAAILLLSQFTFAQDSGWSTTSTVKRIVITANGGVNVYLHPELQGCESQSGYGSGYASIYPSHPGIDRLLSSLLVAKTTKTPIQLYFTDNKCTAVEMIQHDG